KNARCAAPSRARCGCCARRRRFPGSRCAGIRTAKNLALPVLCTSLVSMSVIPPQSRFAKFRNAFFAGLLLIAPVWVTIWAFIQIIEFVGGTFHPLYEHFLPANFVGSNFLWKVLATIFMVLAVAGFGYVSRYVFGMYFLEVGERMIQSIPGV